MDCLFREWEAVRFHGNRSQHTSTGMGAHSPFHGNGSKFTSQVRLQTACAQTGEGSRADDAKSTTMMTMEAR